jgi:Cu-Zn family superoxide dismutase
VGALLALGLAGCGSNDNQANTEAAAESTPITETAPAANELTDNAASGNAASGNAASGATANATAVAQLKPTRGSKISGTVTFTQVANGVRVVADLTGLKPGPHGFHLHEKGDCSSPDAKSAGGHFNPGKMPHGGPTDARRHAGDLGNIDADSSGKAHLDRVDDMLAFSGPDSILGRAVIVHEGRDDLKSQPSGDAGARGACGVVEAAK